MSRIDKINELLRIELANLINREGLLHEGLITIIYVDTSPDLNRAKIGISVLPDKFAGTALKKLRANTSSFSNSLKKKLKIKTIPKFTWIFDNTEREAEKIEEIFKIINKKK